MHPRFAPSPRWALREWRETVGRAEEHSRPDGWPVRFRSSETTNRVVAKPRIRETARKRRTKPLRARRERSGSAATCAASSGGSHTAARPKLDVKRRNFVDRRPKNREHNPVSRTLT